MVVEASSDTTVRGVQVKFYGEAYTRWFTPALTTPLIYRSLKVSGIERVQTEKLELVNEIITLYGQERGANGQVVLQAGEHRFPFRFVLSDLPSTFKVGT